MGELPSNYIGERDIDGFTIAGRHRQNWNRAHVKPGFDAANEEQHRAEDGIPARCHVRVQS